MNLNLGAGDDRREGYVHVDLRPEVADCVADVRALPFDAGSVSHIVALDLLEHLPPADTLPTLSHWADLLEPGGRLTLKVPNLYQLARAIAAYYERGDDGAVHALILNIYGGRRFGPGGAWDAHHWGFTERSLGVTLTQAGFAMTSCDGALNMTAEAVVL